MCAMKRIILFVFGLYALFVNAQSVDFTVPEYANEEFSVAVYNGIKIDTIARGRVTMLGTGKFVVPEKYKEVSVMSTLTFSKKEAKPIDLILHGVPFSFEMKKNGKFVFDGSSENELYYNKQAEVLNGEHKDTYVQSYVKTLNVMVQLSKVLGGQGGASLFEQSSARLALLNNIDVDKLYYSRFWFFAIDGLLRLSAGQEGFANDAIRLIDKTKTEKVFVALVEDVIMILNQYGMDDAFDIVIPHVKSLNRIEYPQGSIYDAFEMIKVMRGNPAPELKGLDVKIEKANKKYTLLVFHQPGCDNCHIQLNQLIARYKFFENNDVRVISISGALDKQAFEAESKIFLWKDKLCDLKGFAGVNYQNYGISGTPTLFLIDSENIILKRFALVSDVEKYIIGASE